MDRSTLSRLLSSYHFLNEAVDQLLTFTSCHPSAFTKPERLPSYTYDDGTEELDVLQIHGGVSINYQGHTYKLPAYLVLPHNFPEVPPLVFMNPNDSMVRNERSPYVDRNLRVVCSYLETWQYPFSSLERLYDQMKADFGLSPPLKRSGNARSDGSKHEEERSRQRAYVDALQEHVNAALDMEHRYLKDALMEEKEREAALDARLAALQGEKEAVEQRISEVTAANEDLTGWLEQAEDTIARCMTTNTSSKSKSKSKTLGSDCVDAYEAAAGGVERARTREVIEAEACARAVQDAVRLLDTGLADGKLTWGAYKKMLSQLAAYKFQSKVVLMKSGGDIGEGGGNESNGNVGQSLDLNEWKYPSVVGLDDLDSGGGVGLGVGNDSFGELEDVLGENPLRAPRGRFKDMLTSSRIFRSVP